MEESLEIMKTDLKGLSFILRDETRIRILLFLYRNHEKSFTAEEIKERLSLKIDLPGIRKHLRVLASGKGIRFGDDKGVLVDKREKLGMMTKTRRRENSYKISEFGLRWLMHYERRALGDKEWPKTPDEKTDAIIKRTLDYELDDYGFIAYLTSLIKGPRSQPDLSNAKTSDYTSLLERHREENNFRIASNLGLVKEEGDFMKLTERGKEYISKIENEFEKKSAEMGIFGKITHWLAFYNPANTTYARVYFLIPIIVIPLLFLGVYSWARIEPNGLGSIVQGELRGAFSILMGYWMIHMLVPIAAAYWKAGDRWITLLLLPTTVCVGFIMVTSVFMRLGNGYATVVTALFLLLYVLAYLLFVGILRTSKKWRLRNFFKRTPMCQLFQH